MACGIAALLMACDTDPSKEELPEALPGGTRYTSTASVWEPSPLTVQSTDLPAQRYGLPRPVRIHAPKSPGTYAVVQFQHGFMGDVHTYDQMLQHIASHGFVVVAPQMYPADGIPLGKPPAAEEAAAAVRMTQWTRQVAPQAMEVASDG